MKATIHVIKNPAGTYSYVGQLPAELADVRPATTADVMGQRAFKAEDGSLATYHFPVSATVSDAIQRAEDRKVADMLCASDGCACRKLFGAPHRHQSDGGWLCTCATTADHRMD